jgi:hypothetical protein
MKNTAKLFFLMVFVVLAMGIVSACDWDCPVEHTEVKGVIYADNDGDGNYTLGIDSPIKDAKVQVTCHHDGNDYTKPAKSDANGEYLVTYYSNTRCDEGDQLTVEAYKKGVGENSEDGEVTDSNTKFYYIGPFYKGCLTLNVGIVNVPLVPEFGVFVGALTLLSGIGIFFLIRKK